MIAGLILAGGRSSRMGGGDKPLLHLAGRPILAHIVERLRPQVDLLALNANGDPARFEAFGLPVVEDTIAGFEGPLAGLLAGLDWAATHAGVTHIASVAGDTPFVPRDLVQRLADTSRTRIVLAASDGETHPVVGLWPLGVRENLRAFLAGGTTRRVRTFTEAEQALAVDFPLARAKGRTVDPFFNVNTPGDLAEAEAIAEDLAP